MPLTDTDRRELQVLLMQYIHDSRQLDQPDAQPIFDWIERRLSASTALLSMAAETIWRARELTIETDSDARSIDERLRDLKLRSDKLQKSYEDANNTEDN